MSGVNTLKELREQRRIDINYVAREINISPAILEKIEAEQFREIGAPVYVRGYILNYARFLGLSEGEAGALVDSLNLGHGPELSLSEANIESQTKSFKKSNTGSLLLLLLVVSAIIVIFSQILNRDSWIMTQIRNTFPPESPTPRPNTELIISNGTATPPSATPTAPAEALPAGELKMESLPTPTEAAPVEALPASTPVPLKLESAMPGNDSGAGAPAPSTSPETNPATVNGDGFTLEMVGNSWVEITDKNKKRLKFATLRKGEKISLPLADAPYSVRITKPDNAHLSLNGQEVELETYKNGNRKDRFRLQVQ